MDDSREEVLTLRIALIANGYASILPIDDGFCQKVHISAGLLSSELDSVVLTMLI